MRAFFGEQGRGRAFIRERRSSEKEPFMDGNLKVGVPAACNRGVGTVVVNRLKIFGTY